MIFKHPFTCVVAGVSGCGKTEFIFQVLKESAHLIEPPIKNIIWVYGIYQERLSEIQREIPAIQLTSSLDSALKLQNKDEEPTLMIIDDFMHSAGKSDKVADLFTKYSHHKQISCFFIVQNLYHKGRSMRDINLNAHYLVLFKSPRDRAQVSYLARQIFPGQTRYFMEAFADATDRPFGYLVVDLKPSTPDNRRLKSRIFSSDNLWVYVPRETI